MNITDVSRTIFQPLGPSPAAATTAVVTPDVDRATWTRTTPTPDPQLATWKRHGE